MRKQNMGIKIKWLVGLVFLGIVVNPILSSAASIANFSTSSMSSDAKKIEKNMKVTYLSQVENKGWLQQMEDGATSGTTGQGLRMEAIKIKLADLPKGESGGIAYSAHVQNVGWQEEKHDGDVAGTVGKSLRMEAIKIRLTGDISNSYSVSYRTHIQNEGWTHYSENNEISGTVNKSLRIEAIEIKLVKKESLPSTELSKTDPVSDSSIDSTMNKTQQWVNKVSDEVEKHDYNLLGANQSTTEGLTLTSTKNLNEDYSVITQAKFGTNGKDATLESVILKGTKEMAIQSVKGKIDKQGGTVFFNYIDNKTKKESKINLTSGHSSAVQAVPVAFSLIGGVAETASLSAAIVAAAPGILIVGGVAVVVGGGYWTYTQIKENRAYSNAHSNRAVGAANAIQLNLSSLGKALEMKDIQKINYHMNRVSSYEKAYQFNISKLDLNLKTINISKIDYNIPKIELNIPRIDINIPKIELNIPKIELKEIDIPKIDLSKFSQSMNSFNESMEDFSKTMADLDIAMNTMNATFAKWPKISANPTFNKVSYDPKTSMLNIEGSMPTASSIEIYVDNKLVRTETTTSGKFNLNIVAKNASVAINAIQQATGDTKYSSPSMLGVMGYPTFKIQENGHVTTNEQTNKLLKTPIAITKDSAKPIFSNVTYDDKTKMMTLVGKMPTASTIEIYNQSDFISFTSKKIGTFSTSSDGNFTITFSVENPVIAINAIQNSTDRIVYSSPYFSSWSYPAVKVLPGGEIVVSEEASKLMKTPEPTLAEKKSANPVFEKVTYDNKTKMMTIVGKMPTESTVDVFSATNYYKSDSKKIKTISTEANGQFEITILVDTPVIYIDPIQKSTSTTRYTSTNSYPAFKVSTEGQVITREYYAPLFKNPPLVEKSSSVPYFSEVSYNSQTKVMTLIGKMPTASVINMYGSSYFADTTLNKLNSTRTSSDGSFTISIPVVNPVISLDAVQDRTSNTIYTEFGSFMRPSFKVYPNGQVISLGGTNNYLKTQKPLPVEKLSAYPVIGSASYDNTKRTVTVPLTMESSSIVKIYKNDVLFKTMDIEGQKQVSLTIPMEKVEDTNLIIDVLQKNTPTIFYDQNSSKKLKFKLWKDGSFTADAFTNNLSSEKLPLTFHSAVSSSPKFTDVTFDSNEGSFKISGKMDSKSSMEVYLNKIKTQTITTNEDGSFNFSIPIDLKEGAETSLSINGTQNSANLFKYSPYMDSIDYSMFTISDKGEIKVSEFAKTLIDVKTVVTPFPTIKPIPIGKGVFVQGETLPYSDVIIKNKGLEFKGKADDKGIFSIPVNEISLEDILEIFVIAPSTATISYTSSESISISGSIPNTTIYTEAEMGIKESKAFENAIEISNGSLTLTSIDQLARLAEINSSAKVVTLGSYVHNSTTSYDQTAYRADNTFFSMGSEGWNTIVKKLEEAGITEIGNEMWRINEKFLENQIGAEKSFEFTLDPNTLVKESFGYREYNYLMNQGYQLQHLNNLWKVAKQ